MGDIFQNGFEAGEIDKWCLGKTGDPAYQLGCARLENFSLLGSGGVNRRQGYKHAGRILEIRPAEYRILDKAGGFEEERRAPDTMSKDEVFRRADTVFGTDTSAARLIPVPGMGSRNCLVYILAQKYGYIEFNGFEAIGLKEHYWPAPPAIKKGHTFARRERDPDAYYKITALSTLNTNALFAVGEKIALQDASVIEPAEAVISGVQASEYQRLAEVSTFEILPESDGKEYVLTQEEGDDRSYFEEKGAGKGLSLSCSCEKKDESSKLSFTVQNGGSGFAASPGAEGSTTTLRLLVESFGELAASAAVGSNGEITSVANITVPGIPKATENVAVMRWEAPVIPEGKYRDVKDWFGRPVVQSPTIRVWVKKADTDVPALGDVYSLTFGEERKNRYGNGMGYGSGWLSKDEGGDGYQATAERPAGENEEYGKAEAYVTGEIDGYVSGGKLYGKITGAVSGNAFEGDITAQVSGIEVSHTDVSFNTAGHYAVFAGLLAGTHGRQSDKSVHAKEESLTVSRIYGFTIIRAEEEGYAGVEIAFEGDAAPDSADCHGWVKPAQKNVCFLKIRHTSNVSGEPCGRELRVVAELEGGRIAYIHPVPCWIDDDIAADTLPSDTDPYGEDGIFSRLFSHAKWWPGGYDNLKLLMNEDGSYMADFTSYYTGSSTYSGRFGANAKVHILEDYGGLWYLKTCPTASYKNTFLVYDSGYLGTAIGSSKRKITNIYYCLFGLHFFYPVMNGKGAYTSIASSTYAASGCPKTLVSGGTQSALPKTQFYNSGRPYTASYKYRLEDRDGRWFMVYSGNIMDDDGNSFGPVVEAENGTYLVEYAGALTGKGAKIRVRPSYSPPARGEGGFGTVNFTVTLLEAGAGYLSRNTGAVTLYLKYREEKQDYMYKVEVNAAGGTDGALVLTGPSGETAGFVNEGGNRYEQVEYEAEAQLNTKPPENRGAVTLTGTQAGVNEGDTTQAEAVVSSVCGADGYLEKWIVRLVIPRSAGGEPMSRPLYQEGETLAASWTRENAAYGGMVVTAVETAGTNTYSARLSYGGRFSKDVAGGAFYGILGGRSYDVYIAGAEAVRAAILKDETDNPVAGRDGNLYAVSADEVYGGIKSYWRWDKDKGEWNEEVASVYPSDDAVLAGLQYCWTGQYLILCGYGITPFTLEIADGDIKLGGLNAVTAVSTDVTAPREFGLSVSADVPDEALPALFMRTANFSPSVTAYINGRLWVSGLPDDPARIYVSKPNREKGSRTFDFSTYKLFVTVTPELTPFQAENNMRENTLKGATDGAIGLADEYARTPLRAGKAGFGYDKARILATPYFPEGAVIGSAGKEIALSKSSVPGQKEYTAEAAAKMRNLAAMLTGVARIKATIPGVNCVVTADGEGFEVRVSSGTQVVGVTNTVGPIAEGRLAVPYTGWGSTGAETASRIVLATAAAVTSAALNVQASIGIAASCAGILTAVYATTYGLLSLYLNQVILGLTDGSSDNPSLSEFGASYATVSAIQAKCEYLLAKHKLYEPKQPFVMRRWKLEEKEYSTPDCGFTFKPSGDGPEAVNVIADARGIFFSTDSGERLMPATVNGAEQSAQSGSFYGSERLQAARGADALYFVMKGGQAVMRAAYAPNVPVPVVTGIQSYNREILRGRKVTGLRSGKTLPVTVWCLTADGGAAVVTDEGGKAAWSRVSSGAGALLDTGAVSVNGLAAIRFVGIRAADGVYIGAGNEAPGGKEGVYLDLWREYTDASLLNEYGDGAVVYDTAARTAVPAAVVPEPGQGKYIGYPYASILRTLPGGTAASLKPARIPAARLRLLESHLPFVRGYPSGMVNRMVHPLWGGTEAELNAVKDGVASVSVPGNIEQDAAFEVFTDVPAPLSVICMITEEEA